MKKHLPLFIALWTVALTIALLAGFILRTRQIVAVQADATIMLPPASRVSPKDDANTLRLSLSANGKVYSKGAELSDFALEQLIATTPDRRITVETEPGVNYEQTKVLLRKLQAAGMKNIVLKTDNL